MTRTQKAFVWASAIGIAIFSIGAAVTGSEIASVTGNRGTSDRFFILVWLGAALLVFQYYVVKGVHTGNAPGGRELFLTLWASGAYVSAVVGLSWLFSSAG